MFPEKDDFINTVRDFRGKAETCGTVHWVLGQDKGRTLALVVGWLDDGGGSCGLAAKIAVQPRNSGMQCDYDIDWDMPYRDDGEVYDNEITLDEASDEGEAWLYFKNIYDRLGAQGMFDWMDGKEAEDGDGGTKAL